jgi:ABC-2 type transport system ATP-binding protein
VLRAEALTKSYGRPSDRPPALDGVSFQIGPGEVVGLLGPNGAGKTTLLRILTCFLAPTRGAATVGGCSITDDPRGARRAVGYLPESAPLPPEMRVDEYLSYRAALKGIARRARGAACDEVMAQAELAERCRQIIGTLSRGTRQRVGLADALLGRPPILILDEPTAGLDPNQVRQMRSVIGRLGGERTVLLSSHALAEVEALASRVIILDRGRVAASAATAEAAASPGGLAALFARATGMDGRSE